MNIAPYCCVSARNESGEWTKEIRLSELFAVNSVKKEIRSLGDHPPGVG